MRRFLRRISPDFIVMTMKLRRVAQTVTALLLLVLWLACGQTYRPVVIPLIPTPPASSNFHSVFALTANVFGNPGTGMQIDVSGDTDVGEASISLPIHAAIAPGGTRLFVASAGSLTAGGTDTVALLSPSSFLGGVLSLTNSVSLPAGSLPDFVATAQNSFVYVANFGSNSVDQINTGSNQIVNSATVGTNPVAMAETPGTTAALQKLYVANQGSNSVTSLNTQDMSQNAVTGFTGHSPVWVVARSDSQKVYVLTQGDGQLVTIDTATDTVSSSLPVGAGANFMFYDPNLNRLYVTNPVTATVYVFSATGGAGDTPTQLLAFPMTGANAPCPAGCSPTSVTALLDGSRFYVASYQTTTCPGSSVAGSCVIPQLTVFDAQSLTLKIPAVTLLSSPPFATLPTAVSTVTTCVTTTPYTPGSTRFRLFTASSADSSRVYVSMCDAGTIADINTTDSNVNNPGNSQLPDTLVLDLPAPFAVCTGSCGGNQPLQNPLFLLTGQ
jgi:YVTN family beta-propeller protein